MTHGLGPAARLIAFEMLGRQHIVLTAGQEHDARHRRRHVAAETTQRRLGHLIDRCLPWTLVPGTTMFGLSSMPSSDTPCSRSAAKTACNTSPVTSSHRSIVCAPSINTSGSTMGTMSCSWQRLA